MREANHYSDIKMLMPVLCACYIVCHILVHLTFVWGVVYVFWRTSFARTWNEKYLVPIGLVAAYLCAWDPFNLLISTDNYLALITGLSTIITAYVCIRERKRVLTKAIE